MTALKPNLFRQCRSRQVLLFLCLLFLGSGSCLSQDVGLWNFNGNTNSGVPGAYNTVSNATFSAGISSTAFNGSTEYYGQDGWPAGALNTNSYLQFSLAPLTGYSLNITSIIIRVRRSNTGSPAGGGPTGWSIRSSLDGYTTDIASGSMTHNYANYTINPGLPFLSLHASVTFRVYGYNMTTSTGAYNRMVFDFIEVTGLGAVLPVHLVSFSANRKEQGVRLNYTLDNTEPGSSYFIQRSLDGIHFADISMQKENYSLDHANYEYVDIALPKNISRAFYRLHILQPDGGSIYSSTIAVRLSDNAASIQASYAGGNLYLFGELRQGSRISVFTAAGVCVYKSVLTSVNNQLIIPSLYLSAGIYFTIMETTDNERKASKFIVPDSN